MSRNLVLSFGRDVARVLAVLALFPFSGGAQQPCERVAAVYSIHGAEFELLRTATLLGQAPLEMEVLRRASRPKGMCVGPDYPGRVRLPAPGNTLELVPLAEAAGFNSAYPRDGNNGVLWSGKGVTAGMSGGLRGRYSVLSAGLQPVLAYSTNQSFDLAETLSASEFGAPWSRAIDLPQRFGDGGFGTFDPGTSYARVDVAGFAAGVSSENVWWGPLRFFPLMMSNSAPGFTHVFLGTGRPVNVGLGHLDAEFIWGRLHESEYFDDDADNDLRLFSGIVLGFSPRGLPGLMLGAARAYHQTEPPGGLSLWEALRAPYVDVRANLLGRDNNLLSVFMRWAMPEAGFEFYAEWGRDDHWEDMEDLILELDHSQAYALGFQKAVKRAADWLRIYGELVHLQSALPYRGGRGAVSFYQNGSATQGHTQRGQMLGAWVGPGADAQILGIDRIAAGLEVGGYLMRARYHDDAYYQSFAPRFASAGHDVELTAGARTVLRRGDFDLELNGTLSRRWNRALANLESGELSAEWNLGLQALVAWFPRWTPLP